MSDSWKLMLAVALAGVSIGVQFISILALQDVYLEIGWENIYLVIQTFAYIFPAVLLALVSGWVGQRIGDRRTATWGLSLVFLGGMGTWIFAGDVTSVLGSRLLAGVGAIVLNVMLMKLVADRFEGRAHLPTAMGVLVFSWPAGAILGMPLSELADLAGLRAALTVPMILPAVALVCLRLTWRLEPEQGDRPGRGLRLTLREFGLVLWGSVIWGLYGLAVFEAIAWAPDLAFKAEVPLSVRMSADLWFYLMAVASLAGGGWLAAQSPWPDGSALASLVLAVLGMIVVNLNGAWMGNPWVAGCLGFVIVFAAATVMTLPLSAVRADVRAFAAGLAWTIFLAIAVFGPHFLKPWGNYSIVLQDSLNLIAGLFAVCFVLFLGFRTQHRRIM